MSSYHCTEVATRLAGHLQVMHMQHMNRATPI